MKLTTGFIIAIIFIIILEPDDNHHHSHCKGRHPKKKKII